MSSGDPTLRDLQKDMQHYLLGETSGVTSAIVDAPPLRAKDRLAIYRNAYQVRLIDATASSCDRRAGMPIDRRS